MAFCSQFHHHSSIEESWRASKRRCSPHLGDFKPVKQLRPPVSSMTLRTLLPLSFCLSTKTNHYHHSWQTEEKKTCTTETTTMDLRDDLSTPIHLPFYWGPVRWTGGTVGSREHLNWPSTPWLWSTDEWLSMMTKRRTVPSFDTRQRRNRSGDSAVEPY